MNQKQRSDRQSAPWAGWFCRGLLAGLTALGMGCAKKEAPAAGRPPTPVTVVAAQQKDVPVYIDAFGRLVSVSSVDIQPQISGKLVEAPFTEGASVKKGDVLFRIDDSETKAQVAKVTAAVAGDRADLKLKEATLERNQKLFERSLISQETFDGYQNDVESARAKLAADEASLTLARIDLDYCTLTAPMDGIAGKRLVDPGNLVAANNTKLVNLRTIDPLFVDFTVPEKYIGLIRAANARGTLTISFLPERDMDPILIEASKQVSPDLDAIRQKIMTKSYEGKLALIDNAVDDTTGTIALRARADNAEGNLWPGQFVTLGLIVETVKEAVMVPGSCVLYGKQGPYAYVVGGDNKAQLRLLELGPAWMGYLLVTKGVQVGEKVVALGQLGLYPGADVIVLPSQPAASAGAGNAAAGRSADDESQP